METSIHPTEKEVGDDSAQPRVHLKSTTDIENAQVQWPFLSQKTRLVTSSQMKWTPSQMIVTGAPTLQSNQFQNFKLDWFSNIYQLWHPSSTSKHRLSLLHRLIGCRNVKHLSGMLVFVKPFDISLIAFSNRPVFLTIHVAIFELLNF